jgi:hypothetical protein
MPYCRPRSIDQHAGAGKAHYFPHLFAHGRFVAVYGTLLAGTFLFTEGTTVQPCVGVMQQFFTCRTESPVLFFFAAVEADHQFYSPFFTGDTVLIQFSSFLGDTKIGILF